jgi:hypothetical protein
MSNKYQLIARANKYGLSQFYLPKSKEHLLHVLQVLPRKLEEAMWIGHSTTVN